MKKIFITAFFFLFAFEAFAYGPYDTFNKNNKNEPYTWMNGTVQFKYEPGRLSKKVPLFSAPACKNINAGEFCSEASLTTCGIQKCIEQHLDAWKNVEVPLPDGTKVKTTNLNISPMSAIEKKVDTYNEYKDAEKDAINGKYVVIIFDEDGSILEALDNPDVLGLTLLAVRDSAPFFKSGAVILNGKVFDGDTDVADLTASELSATIIHELGHALGLDHTQPLLETLGTRANSKPPKQDQGIPTMYPITITGEQSSLHRDDRIGISYLYPSEDFKKKFCVIKGKLINSENDTPYQGLNVIAYANKADDTSTEKYIDARSFVSGVLYPPQTANGDYYLEGIIPGYEYKVVVEAINPMFIAGSGSYSSSINPHDDPEHMLETPTAEEIASNVIWKGDSSVVKCDITDDGKTVVMDDKGLVPPEDTDDGDTDDGSGSQKKGWCMSVGGSYPASLWLFWPLMALAAAGIKKTRFIQKR